MLDKFCKYLIAEKRYSEHTVNAYRADITDFFEYANISTNESDEVTHHLVRSWIAALLTGGSEKQKLSTRSVNRKIAALRGFFNYLRRENLVANNPMTKVILPKIKKPLPVFLVENKLNNYLNLLSADESYENIRDNTIIELLYGTGMRAAELVNLQCHDIDFSNKIIKVLGKGNKQRNIPMSVHIENILTDYFIARQKSFPQLPDDSLFLTTKSKKIYAKLIYLIVHKKLTEGGFTEKRSPHVLRHSFATHMLNNNADLNGIKELLGHANLAATQVYTHNSFQKMKMVYKKAHPHAEEDGKDV